MKTSVGVVAALAVAAWTLQPATARAATSYPWCMQPVGTWGPDCYYATIEQCRASAAGVGFCYQNPAFTAASRSRPPRTRR